MGKTCFCRTAFFTFALATIFVSDTLAQDTDFYDPEQIRRLEFEPRIGALTLTNDSCVNGNPFADPDDVTVFYQCFWIDDGAGNGFWYMQHMQCTPGGYFDPIYLTCLEIPDDPNPTTMAPEIPFRCAVEGIFPHASDCANYYKCIILSGQMVTYVMTCPLNTFFDPMTLQCKTGTCNSTPTDPSPTCTTPGIFSNPSDCAKYFRCDQVNGNWYIYMYTCPPDSYFDNTVPGCLLGNCPAN